MNGQSQQKQELNQVESRFNNTIIDIIKFSLPIIFGQIGMMLIGVGDVFIASKHGTETVAAIGVATGVINPIFLFGIGLMMGISPSMSIKRGAGEDTHGLLKSALGYSFIAGLVITFLTLILNLFVPYMGFKEEIVNLIIEYIDIVAWSFPFALMFQAVKEYLQSFEKVMLPNVIAIIAVFVNLGLNYIFVFGALGFPPLGAKGLAFASLGIRIFQCFLVLFFVRSHLFEGKFSTSFLVRTFKFSLPIAFMFFLEVMAFCLVLVLVGGMGVAIAAANNIVMNLASITFMVPLSISSAVAVKVGAKYGAKDILGMKHYSFASLILSIGFMSCSAFCFVNFPEYLMGLFTPDTEVIALGAGLLAVVAIFQLADGTQVTLSGILRGMHKTKETLIAVFVGYWLIGIPMGTYLAYKQDYGALGLWIGLATSLAIVAIFLSILFSMFLKRGVVFEGE